MSSSSLGERLKDTLDTSFRAKKDTNETTSYVNMDTQNPSYPKRPLAVGYTFLVTLIFAEIHVIALLVFLVWGYIVSKTRAEPIHPDQTDIIREISVAGFVIRIVLYIIKGILLIIGLVSVFAMKPIVNIVFCILYGILWLFDLLLVVFGILALINYNNDTINAIIKVFDINSIEETLTFFSLDGIVLAVGVFFCVFVIKYNVQKDVWQKKSFV